MTSSMFDTDSLSIGPDLFWGKLKPTSGTPAGSYIHTIKLWPPYKRLPESVRWAPRDVLDEFVDGDIPEDVFGAICWRYERMLEYGDLGPVGETESVKMYGLEENSSMTKWKYCIGGEGGVVRIEGDMRLSRWVNGDQTQVLGICDGELSAMALAHGAGLSEVRAVNREKGFTIDAVSDCISPIRVYPRDSKEDMDSANKFRMDLKEHRSKSKPELPCTIIICGISDTFSGRTIAHDVGRTITEFMKTGLSLTNAWRAYLSGTTLPMASGE